MADQANEIQDVVFTSESDPDFIRVKLDKMTVEVSRLRGLRRDAREALDDLEVAMPIDGVAIDTAKAEIDDLSGRITRLSGNMLIGNKLLAADKVVEWEKNFKAEANALYLKFRESYPGATLPAGFTVAWDGSEPSTVVNYGVNVPAESPTAESSPSDGATREVLWDVNGKTYIVPAAECTAGGKWSAKSIFTFTGGSEGMTVKAMTEKFHERIQDHAAVQKRHYAEIPKVLNGTVANLQPKYPVKG